MDRRRAGTPAAVRTLTKSPGPVRPRPVLAPLASHTVASLARACYAKADQRRRGVEASRDQLGVLVEQQAALRRVATLVARGVSPCEVFSAVVRELPHCLGVSRSALVRYEPGGAPVKVASLGELGSTNTPDSKRFSLAHIRKLGVGNEVGGQPGPRDSRRRNRGSRRMHGIRTYRAARPRRDSRRRDGELESPRTRHDTARQDPAARVR